MTAVHHGSSELTMAVVGCGTMGISILSGVLASLREMRQASSRAQGSSDDSVPRRLPSRFLACVRSRESAARIEKALAEHLDVVEVVRNDNVSAAQRAGVVLLGCKPWMVEDVLAQPGFAGALRGKLLVSVVAGVTEEKMRGLLRSQDPAAHSTRIVRVVPNTAGLIREGMTAIAEAPDAPLPPDDRHLVDWLFRCVGDVVWLPPAQMDVCSSLCGSAPAFFALVLEAAADGAVAMGLPRAAAQRIAARAMRGAASLVLAGEHPAVLREKVSTPGGCTIGGLLVLEEGAVRGTVARAVREATVVAGQLGQGVQGVNGTRFPAAQRK